MDYRTFFRGITRRDRYLTWTRAKSALSRLSINRLEDFQDPAAFVFPRKLSPKRSLSTALLTGQMYFHGGQRIRQFRRPSRIFRCEEAITICSPLKITIVWPTAGLIKESHDSLLPSPKRKSNESNGISPAHAIQGKDRARRSISDCRHLAQPPKVP